MNGEWKYSDTNSTYSSSNNYSNNSVTVIVIVESHCNSKSNYNSYSNDLISLTVTSLLAEDPDADQQEDVKDSKPPPQTQKRQRQVAISGESLNQSAVDIDFTEYPKDAE
jgi:hypothetical protein